jgi:hypothetical protein
MAGAALLLAGTAPVMADTVVKQTTVTQKEIPDTNKVNFSAMDLNHDGILSRAEVGRKLFYIFDTDGNEVIDNIEFNKEKVMTIIPLQKQELTMIDFNDDGIPDTTQYSAEEFANYSMLNRFDTDSNGLSAAEFIGQPFLKMDTNRDKVIDINEWRDAYIKSLSPKSAKQYRYND